MKVQFVLVYSPILMLLIWGRRWAIFGEDLFDPGAGSGTLEVMNISIYV